jgi:general secretion pathway protein K
VDRAILELFWIATFQGDRKIKEGAAWVDYTFPTGVAHVQLMPETSKLDVNRVPPDRLMRLVTALGVEPGPAMEITQAILARRGGESLSPSLDPSFSGHGASLQEVEELLSVRGVTPEIFYGTYVPARDNPGPGEPRLIRRSGLVECLSVFGSRNAVDANTADPAVLAALGFSPDGIQLLLQQRQAAPLTMDRLGQMAPVLGPAAQFLTLETKSTFTIRATARVRLPNGQLSDMKRTVAAQIKFLPYGYQERLHVLRWYDTTWSN